MGDQMTTRGEARLVVERRGLTACDPVELRRLDKRLLMGGTHPIWMTATEATPHVTWVKRHFSASGVRLKPATITLDDMPLNSISYHIG